MTELTMKKKIFDKIQNFKNKEFLRKIYNLLDLQSEQEELFQLPKEQKKQIEGT